MHATEQDPPLELQAGFNYRMALCRLLAGPRNRGLDASTLLRDSDIDAAILDSDSEVSRHQYIHLLAKLSMPLQDEFFGL